MTPKNATAREKAIEALISASLRAPDKETEVTQEEINRYVDQHVTLNSEDKTALEKSKPDVMQAIKSILLGNGQEDNATATRRAKAECAETSMQTTHRKASNEFVEAVLIAQLTRLIATPQYPLGHFRQNKMIYFAHRRTEDEVTEFFMKQPAGPYSSRAKYQGPERIAQQQGYVKKSGTEKKSGFLVGDNIHKIDQYVSRYPVCIALDWVVGKFRYRKNEDLELLATVDFAALELIRSKKMITMENVKHVIATSKKWTAKLNREIFSDANIERALIELKNYFPTTYA
jgi:type I restriction enzyme S subunit